MKRLFTGVMCIWLSGVVAAARPAAAAQPGGASTVPAAAPTRAAVHTGPAVPAFPATPTSNVEERWGIRILGVRLTAAGYMLDFRYHVTDAAKAGPLFVRGLQPTLRDEASGSTFIVPAPPKLGPMRTTNPPQAGRTYFMFFANPARFVAPGSAVTITVGDFRVEHLKVMAEAEPFPETPKFDSTAVLARDGFVPAVSLGRARPAKVTTPDVALTDQDGRSVRLSELAGGDSPVILTFMYTSCATHCSTIAATLARVQRDLGDAAAAPRIISVSIDPEQDSPARTREFLAHHGARPGWSFLTGTPAASEGIQRAFDVSRGNKVGHPPAIFIRGAGAGDWWRIGGLPSAEVVVSEFRRVVGSGK